MNWRDKRIAYYALQLGYVNAVQVERCAYMEGGLENLWQRQKVVSEIEMAWVKFLFLKQCLLQSAVQAGHLKQEQCEELLKEKIAAFKKGDESLVLNSLERGLVPAQFYRETIEKLHGQRAFTDEEYRILSTIIGKYLVRELVGRAEVSAPPPQPAVAVPPPSPISGPTADEKGAESKAGKNSAPDGFGDSFFQEFEEKKDPPEITDTMRKVLPKNPSERDPTEIFQAKVYLGPYELLELIGEGGMGKVFKAFHPRLEKFVAIKSLSHTAKISERERKRFLAEAQLTANLKHPNIVAVHDVATAEGQDYIVMDFIRGNTLEKLLQRSSLSARRSLEIIKDAALAMEYAHHNNIVHRDLKPANLIIEENTGVPMIMDFGLAKNIKVSMDVTKSGEILGTPRYMAPEQTRGKAMEITPLADVYALGAVLYEMLAGTPAVEGSNALNIIYNIHHKPIIPLRKRNPKLAVELETICAKALEKNPGDRYQNAKAFAEDIERFLRGEVILANPGNIWYRSLKKMQQHQLVTGMFAVLLVLVLALAVWAGQKTQRETAQRRMRVENDIQKVESLLRALPGASDLEERYQRDLYREMSILEEQERMVTLKNYMGARMVLEHALALAPEHQRLKRRLYEVEKEIGLLAMGGANYLLAELSFLRCKSLGWAEESEDLLERLEHTRGGVETAQVERIHKIMSELNKTPEQGILDEYIIEIAQMRGGKTVSKLLDSLKKSTNQWQRQVAIESLGILGDSYTLLDDKDAAQWLRERLEKLDTRDQGQMEEAKYLVRSLGRLKDPRADELVWKKRWESGQNSIFWIDTAVGYSLIPLPKQYPQNVRDWNQMGIKKIEKRKWEEAKDDYERAMLLYPDVPELYNNLGIAYARLGNTPKAIASYSKAIALSPRMEIAYNNRGIAYYFQKEYLSAVTDHNQAIQIDHRLAMAYYNLMFAYGAMGHKEPGMLCMYQLYQLNPAFTTQFFRDTLSADILTMMMTRKPPEETQEKFQMYLEQYVPFYYYAFKP